MGIFALEENQDLLVDPIDPAAEQQIDQELSTALSEVELRSDAIADASSAIEDLEQYQDIIDSVPEGTELPESTAQAIEVAVESLRSRLGMHSRPIGLESYSNKRVALEGAIGDTLKSTWEAIKKAFKKVAEFIKGLFSKMFGKDSKLDTIEDRLNKLRSLSRKDTDDKFITITEGSVIFKTLLKYITDVKRYTGSKEIEVGHAFIKCANLTDVERWSDFPFRTLLTDIEGDISNSNFVAAIDTSLGNEVNRVKSGIKIVALTNSDNIEIYWSRGEDDQFDITKFEYSPNFEFSSIIENLQEDKEHLIPVSDITSIISGIALLIKASKRTEDIINRGITEYGKLLDKLVKEDSDYAYDKKEAQIMRMILSACTLAPKILYTAVTDAEIMSRLIDMALAEVKKK